MKTKFITCALTLGIFACANNLFATGKGEPLYSELAAEIVAKTTQVQIGLTDKQREEVKLVYIERYKALSFTPGPLNEERKAALEKFRKEMEKILTKEQFMLWSGNGRNK